MTMTAITTPAGRALPVRIPRRWPEVEQYAAAAGLDVERLTCVKCRALLCVRCLGCHCAVVRCRCTPRACCSGGGCTA